MGALQQLKSFAKLSRGTSDSGGGGGAAAAGGGSSSTVFAGRQRNGNSSSSSSNYKKKKHSFETLQWRLEEAHLFWDRGESTQAIQLGKRIEKVARIAAIGGGGNSHSQKQWNFEVDASMTNLTLLRAAALSSIGR